MPSTPLPPKNDISATRDDAFRLRAILDATVDGIITIDSTGSIESVNRSAEIIFGYDAEEMVGRNVSFLMPEPYHSEHGDYMRRYLETGEAKIIGIGREVEGRRKNGDVFPMSLAVGEVKLDHRVLFTGIVRDLTPQRLIEAELKRRDQQVQFMVEHLPAGAVYVDCKNHELFCNPTVERITGYGREKLSTFDDWFETLFARNAAEVRAAYEEDRKQKFEVIRTFPYWHADGTERILEMSGYRYNNHEVWLIRDITEHREAERRAVQAERLAAIGQMVTGLAHESRNALQRAQAGLDVLSLDVQAPQQTLVGGVRRALSDLTKLYEEVRQYAAPIHLKREPALLRDVWTKAWQSLSTKLEEKPVRLIEVVPDDEATRCDIDAFRMEQVFRNIFENAIEVSPERGAIKITVNCGPAHGHSFEVTIADEGPGLDANQKARVFEPFYTTKQRGTGLGMAIVARIVELHDGTIRVEDGESGGARFRIRMAHSSRRSESPEASVGGTQ